MQYGKQKGCLLFVIVGTLSWDHGHNIKKSFIKMYLTIVKTFATGNIYKLKVTITGKGKPLFKVNTENNNNNFSARLM